MKHPILAVCLFLACCASPGLIVVEEPVVRLGARVIDRHNAYVEADANMDAPFKAAALSESAEAWALLSLPQVSAVMLDAALEPVMSRHDNYVVLDATLSELERGIYLESTVRLRGYLSAFLPVEVAHGAAR